MAQKLKWCAVYTHTDDNSLVFEPKDDKAVKLFKRLAERGLVNKIDKLGDTHQ